MNTTIILARVFGSFLIVIAGAVFLNRKALMRAVTAMFEEPFAEWVAAIVALLGGIAYVNLYEDWSSLPAGILSAIGWLILLKGLLYAFLPSARLAKLTKILNEDTWYTRDGVRALVVGVYLAGFGFGLW